MIHLLLCRRGKSVPPAITAVAKQFNAKLYVATNEKQVRAMLREQPIELVLVGSGLSPEMRGAMIQAIASIRDDLCVHMNGDVRGGLTFAQFMVKTLTSFLPKH